MDRSDILEAGGFYFIHNFDSGNLGQVERVPTDHIVPSLNYRTNNLETPEFEFNVWTRPDCCGTEFENGNRTWFYFGIQGGKPNSLVRLNIINLNKQGKMYSQGMAPVTRTLPGQPHWERIRDRPVHCTDENAFTLTFKYRTPENMKATTFFAFTYPFSFTELQIALNAVDQKLLPLPSIQNQDDIYYCRENVVYTLEGRRTDMLTISSYHGITNEREERLKNLFPDRTERPFKFSNKKVIFISARVHPGETPSSFVFNGFLNLLLTKSDPIAMQLRRLYVFKLVPFLNPDGVARGNYRTDTRGVNLNRVYLNPSLEHHPTVYAARALIRYYHYGFEKEDDPDEKETKNIFHTYSRSIPSVSEETLPAINMKAKKKPQVFKNKDVLKREIKQSPTASVKTLTGVRSLTSTKTSVTTSTSRVESANKSNTGDKLAAQVCDMNIKEKCSVGPSKMSMTCSRETCTVTPSCNLLDEVVVRDCLGSEVRISRSDELNTITGPNPLKELRDTLKNSISLLVSGNPYTVQAQESDEMWPGWHREKTEAKKILGKKENEADPSLVTTPEISKCIGEEIKRQNVFCANYLTENDSADLEVEINPELNESSGVVSGGDRADVCSLRPSSEEPAADNNGDTAENKTRTAGKAKKKIIPFKHPVLERRVLKEPDSGLYLYVDLHGHASKKGIFMYGNHFDEAECSVECMLLPRIMSLNNLHFHFSSCNFTERNMYLKDRRDGMSREGSGRVAVLKATGLIRSYTLECNYNTGRLVNILPPTLREPGNSAATGPPPAPLAPPKYTPHIFEEVNPFQVGRSLGASILDLTGQHPNSRIPGSEHRSLGSLREWLRSHMRSMRPSQITMSRLRPKTASPNRAPLYSRPLGKNKIIVDVERKENTYIGAKPEEAKKAIIPRSGRTAEISLENYNTLSKKAEKSCHATRTRCFTESDKPKSLTSKRRNVLAIRKPNAGKARNSSGGKGKLRRPGEETGITARGKGSFISRTFRRESKMGPMSSSSEEVLGAGWEEAGGSAGSKRRPHPPPIALTAPRLKKIRLKTNT